MMPHDDTQPAATPSRRVSLWENRRFPPLDPACRTGSAAHRRARQHFATNPEANFYLDEVTHPQLQRMSAMGAFSGAFGHPPERPNKDRRYAEIAGPGPHGLVFRHDWYAGSIGPDADNLPSRFHWRASSDLVQHFATGLPPGVLLVPNLPVRTLPSDPAKRESIARTLWEEWEASTGGARADPEIRAETQAIVASVVNS
jgi:hypothetical protein